MIAPLLVLLLLLASADVARAQPLQGSSLTITDTTGAFIRAPRLTQAQRNNSTHNLGEIIYCSDCPAPGLQTWNGASWTDLTGGGGVGGGTPTPPGGPAGSIQFHNQAIPNTFAGTSAATLNGASGGMALTGAPSITVNNPNVGYWPSEVLTTLRVETSTGTPTADEAAAAIIMHNTGGQFDLTTALAVGVSHESTSPNPSTTFGILTGVVLQPTATNNSPVIGNRIAVTNQLANRAGNTGAAGQPVSIGLLMLSQGAFSNTTAFSVSSSDASRWGDGLLFSSTAIAAGTGVTIRDQGSPLRSLSIEGTPTFGVYQSNTTTTKNLLGGGAILGPVATLPAFGNAGRVLYQSSDQRLYVDTGTAWSAAGGATGGHAIQDELDAPLTARPTLAFVGAGVTATDDPANNRTKIEIAGGAAGTVSGTGTSPQLAFFTGASSLSSVPGLTWASPKLSAPNAEILPAPSLTIAPTANPPTTLAAFSVQVPTNAAGGRQFAGHFGLTSSHGGPAGSDKVALYAATRALSGTTDAWALNTVTTQEAASGSYNAFGYELDFNNLNVHRGDTDGLPGLTAPVSYGLGITGASSFRSTAAVLIHGTSTQWNRGIVIAGGMVDKSVVGTSSSSFQDLTSPHKSVDIRGAPFYGVYQSNAASLNLMAGGLIAGPVTDTLPAAGNPGRLLFRNSEKILYADDGASWRPASAHVIALGATEKTHRRRLSFTGSAVTGITDDVGNDSTVVTIAGGSATRLDVKLHGATGNNSSNDLPGLQAAADALCNTGGAGSLLSGGTLYLSPGIYRINGPLLINCGMVIEGAGWNDVMAAGGTSIVMTSTTQDGIIVDAPNQVIIRNLAIRTLGTQTAGVAIHYKGFTPPNGQPVTDPNTSCFTRNPGARIENVLIHSPWIGVGNAGGGLCSAEMHATTIANFQKFGVEMHTDGEGGIGIFNGYIWGITAAATALVNAGATNSFLHSQGPATVIISGAPRLNVITSLTRSGTTATAVTQYPHGFRTGSPGTSVTVAGATQGAYNLTFTVVSVPTVNSFTYTVSGSPATPATGSPTARFTTNLHEGGALVGNIIEGGPSTVAVSIQLKDSLMNTSRIVNNSIYGARAGIQVAAVGGTNNSYQAFTITGNLLQLNGNSDGSCLDLNDALNGVVAGNSCNFGSTAAATAGAVVRENTSFIDFGINQYGANVDTPYTTLSTTPTSIRLPVYQISDGRVFINTDFSGVPYGGIDNIIMHGQGGNGMNLKFQGNGATTPFKTVRVTDGFFEVLNNAYSMQLVRLSETLTTGTTGTASNETVMWLATNRGGSFSVQRVKMSPANLCPNAAGTANSARCLIVDN